MTLYTIGYEGLALEGFLGLLTAHGIDHLVDIRDVPLSRKPGFSKTALAVAVESVGLRYSHVKALGCPKSIRDRHRADRDWAQYIRSFETYLATQAAAVEALRATAAASRTCLLCYEADASRCHRRFVADAVAGPTGTISHIGTENSATG